MDFSGNDERLCRVKWPGKKPRGGDGRIPFRIRVGVTGHRDAGGEELLEVVRKQIRRLYGTFDSKHTEVRLSVISQLADGADRLVVREVLTEAWNRGHDASSEAILPLAYEDYVDLQGFSRPSQEELDQLLGTAVAVSSPSDRTVAETSESRARAYEAAGRQLVARCDVLLALWDGEQTGGKGGTAETLLYAASLSKPCIWISTDGEPTVKDNLGDDRAEQFHREVEKLTLGSLEASRRSKRYPARSLEVLERSFDDLDRFNGGRASGDFKARFRSEIASGPGEGDWMAAPFVRATILADRWSALFAWASRLITLAAALAAAALAIGLSYETESSIWGFAEAGLFLFAILGLGIARGFKFHRRWLTYRVLAERLRIAHFLAPTGVDFRRQARLEGVFVDGQATGWIMRAFEEVWDRRPQNPLALDEMDPARFERFKQTLANDWIGRQITYHEDASERHRRTHRLLGFSIVTLFLATIVFALLHASHNYENAAIFFSVALPAAGASLGVLLTVTQPQALSERSARMLTDLGVVRANILNATPDTLGKASSEAARVIAQETGAWFGSMWFLDIEHP